MSSRIRVSLHTKADTVEWTNTQYKTLTACEKSILCQYTKSLQCSKKKLSAPKQVKYFSPIDLDQMFFAPFKILI